jgi:hypothetical protein
MAEKQTKSNVSKNFALKVAIPLQSQHLGVAKLLSKTLEMVEHPYEMTEHLERPMRLFNYCGTNYFTVKL